MLKTNVTEYRHQWLGGEEIPLPVGKVVCVGRNYAEHAKELNNPIPTEPLLFMKPSTSLVPFSESISIPKGFGEVHYESEIAILIGKRLSVDVGGQLPDQASVGGAIEGVAASLDLTLRELQSDLKSKGQPWEKAKAFDGACPVSQFVKPELVGSLTDLTIGLAMDGVQVQSGCSKDMLTPIVELLRYITQFFTLMPGDVVLTGTPKGVGQIQPGQQLTLQLGADFRFDAQTV
ncbi:fumarylacetoacetate hydrolase family protein [Litoribrevibacter euphylliae]|uniref:Fumarylacetoacetate hydrolase family protein n=1 Tax=Litoribrevibacter euphylliae TaxID=1834034 RepID=A0ABV7HHT0_9GAMM